MEQLFFTISFLYDIVPGSFQVHLNAEIKMMTEDSCIVQNIRRVHTDESPLLPQLDLIYNNGKWVHRDSGNESNISKAIGEAIAQRRSEILKDRDPKKDSY